MIINLQQLTLNLQPNPWLPRTCSILVLVLRLFWTPNYCSPLVIQTRVGPHGKHVSRVKNACLLARYLALGMVRITEKTPLLLSECVFIGPLPSTGHGADHIENTSSNTFSIFFTVGGALRSCIIGGFSGRAQLMKLVSYGWSGNHMPSPQLLRNFRAWTRINYEEIAECTGLVSLWKHMYIFLYPHPHFLSSFSLFRS
jgi:hypothetical protein